MEIPVAVFRETRTNEQLRNKVLDHYDKFVSQAFTGDAGGNQIAHSNIHTDGEGSQRLGNVPVSH